MIHNILFYVCLPIVILIVTIGILYFLLIALPELRYQNAQFGNDPDYDDPDWSDDDGYGDYDPDIELESFAYPELDEVHLMAVHLWGDATEYTVAHVRKLLEMENDVADFMSNQDSEVYEYIERMKVAA